MNAITTEQIEFLRNQLPDIVKRFNEKHKCNTKLFEWTRLYFKDGSLQPDRLLTIESLIDPSVERLVFAQGFVYDKKLLYWRPVFAGDVLYYNNNTKHTICATNMSTASYSRLNRLYYKGHSYILCCPLKSPGSSVGTDLLNLNYLDINKLSFYPKSDVLTYVMTNLDGERETLELPRPIKNTDALAGSGNYWYTNILGVNYYFLTEEDRNEFVRVIYKSLKYSEVDYDI